MMPDFIGSAVEATRQGATVEMCRICGNWEWVCPGDYPAVVLPACGRREREAQAARQKTGEVAT